MTEAFDDLRDQQDGIIVSVKKVLKTFRGLQEEEEEVDEDFGALEGSVKTSRYCEDREGVMERIRQWMMESAHQITENYSTKAKDDERLQRIVDFVNKCKVVLRKTTPLGIKTEDNEQDKAFLDQLTSVMNLTRLAEQLRIDKNTAIEMERFYARKEASKATSGPPSVSWVSGYALRNIEGKQRGSASSTQGMEGIKPQETSTPDARKKAVMEKRKKKQGEGKVEPVGKMETIGKKRRVSTEVVIDASKITDNEDSSQGKGQLSVRDLVEAGVKLDESDLGKRLAEASADLRKETEAAEEAERKEGKPREGERIIEERKKKLKKQERN